MAYFTGCWPGRRKAKKLQPLIDHPRCYYCNSTEELIWIEVETPILCKRPEDCRPGDGIYICKICRSPEPDYEDMVEQRMSIDRYDNALG